MLCRVAVSWRMSGMFVNVRCVGLCRVAVSWRMSGMFVNVRCVGLCRVAVSWRMSGMFVNVRCVGLCRVAVSWRMSGMFVNVRCVGLCRVAVSWRMSGMFVNVRCVGLCRVAVSWRMSGMFVNVRCVGLCRVAVSWRKPGLFVYTKCVVYLVVSDRCCCSCRGTVGLVLRSRCRLCLRPLSRFGACSVSFSLMVYWAFCRLRRLSGVGQLSFLEWGLSSLLARNVCRWRRGCVRPPISVASCRCQRCRGSGCLLSFATLCGTSLWPLVCLWVTLSGTPLASGPTSRFRLRWPVCQVVIWPIYRRYETVSARVSSLNVSICLWKVLWNSGTLSLSALCCGLVPLFAAWRTGTAKGWRHQSMLGLSAQTDAPSSPDKWSLTHWLHTDPMFSRIHEESWRKGGCSVRVSKSSAFASRLSAISCMCSEESKKIKK